MARKFAKEVIIPAAPHYDQTGEVHISHTTHTHTHTHHTHNTTQPCVYVWRYKISRVFKFCTCDNYCLSVLLETFLYGQATYLQFCCVIRSTVRIGLVFIELIHTTHPPLHCMYTQPYITPPLIPTSTRGT